MTTPNTFALPGNSPELKTAEEFFLDSAPLTAMDEMRSLFEDVLVNQADTGWSELADQEV